MEDKKEHKFKNGDLVQLKSGIPLRMTVKGYKNEFVSDFKIFKQSDTEVECYWIQDNEQKFGIFHQDELELAQ
jgi:uncharacterized protein YodC (DUF2158 family)